MQLKHRRLTLTRFNTVSKDSLYKNCEIKKIYNFMK